MEKESEQNDSSEVALEHDEEEPQEAQQSKRTRRAPSWHSDYVMESNVAYCLLIEDGEPSTFQEAVSTSDASQWMAAMQEEIEALHKNKT